MGILLLKQKRKMAETYMNLGSEDLVSSLLWTSARTLDPNLVLRNIVNEAVGWEAIGEGELVHDNVRYELWRKIKAPIERRFRHTDLICQRSLFEDDDPVSFPEGDTECDIHIEMGNSLTGEAATGVLIIEAKLDSKLSTRTTHDPSRGQAIRTVDALVASIEDSCVSRLFYILLDTLETADKAIEDLRNPEEIRNLLPYRDFRQISGRSIAKGCGHLSYKDLRNVIARVKRQLIPEQQVVADDVIALLDYVMEGRCDPMQLN